MSETIYLEPEKVAELEPSEKSAHGSIRLSAFAVPISARVTLTPEGGLSAITFVYSGGEKGTDFRPLDEESTPAVTIRVGQYTQAILELQFLPPLGPPHPDGLAELLDVCRRLDARAAGAKTSSARLSYILISRILRQSAEQFLTAANK